MSPVVDATRFYPQPLNITDSVLDESPGGRVISYPLSVISRDRSSTLRTRRRDPMLAVWSGLITDN